MEAAADVSDFSTAPCPLFRHSPGIRRETRGRGSFRRVKGTRRVAALSFFGFSGKGRPLPKPGRLSPKPEFWESLSVILFFLLSPFAFGGETDILSAAGTDLSQIYNRPQVVSSSISWETPEDKSRWISMDAEVHVFSDLPFGKLCEISRDMKNFPSFFKRIRGTRVTALEDSSLLEMSVSVGLMGVNYETAYTMYVTEPVNTQSRLLIDYSFLSGDGLLKNDAHGTWFLEAASLNGTPGTYVRYTAHGVVLKKFPLQETIMEIFVNREHVDIMNQFLRAGRRYTP
jgi:hypothetical protein